MRERELLEEEEEEPPSRRGTSSAQTPKVPSILLKDEALHDPLKGRRIRGRGSLAPNQ